jgi:ribosomal 50S subunit-recycling heat shock protein
MSSEYNKEVDNFLSEVDKLTEEDISARDAAAHASSIASESDGVDVGAADETVKVAAKDADKRHRWKIQNVVGEYHDKEAKTKKYCNPFLDDRNIPDLIFSELLIQEQPYRADVKGAAIEEFVLKCKAATNDAGLHPLELLSASTYRSRTIKYRTLATYWNDKTGPVMSNGKALGVDWKLKSYKDMTVAEKIAFNVDNYIEDYKCVEKEASKKEAEALQAKQQKEEDDTASNALTAKAIGKLAKCSNFY